MMMVTNRIVDLSTQLCKAVLETFYDIQKVVLPSATISKEVKKQVRHVVNSLIPPDSTDRPNLSRRSSRLSEFSLVDGSPIVFEIKVPHQIHLYWVLQVVLVHFWDMIVNDFVLFHLYQCHQVIWYMCVSLIILNKQQTDKVFNSFDIYTPSK